MGACCAKCCMTKEERAMYEMKKQLDKDLGGLFGDLEGQMKAVQDLKAKTKKELEKKKQDVMPKLLRQGTRNRIEAFSYIAEAVNEGMAIDNRIYERLFDQYDTNKSGYLEWGQIKNLVRDVAKSQVELCERVLTSGELEKQMEGNPIGKMMLPALRGEVESKKRVAQAKVDNLQDYSVEEVKNKMDMAGDDRISKTEFMAHIEHTFWFEQQTAAKMRQEMGNLQTQMGGMDGQPPECQTQ